MRVIIDKGFVNIFALLVEGVTSLFKSPRNLSFILFL